MLMGTDFVASVLPVLDAAAAARLSLDLQ